ncbi:hemolysin-III related-domain-containing protein [Mycena rebaudengoi]|nr:hemolysin-III related-domain-containing protein [Mycena rebaudengoi]
MSTPIRRRQRKPTGSIESPIPILNTIRWIELPEWQKDNEYIVSGYRVVQNHWRGCFVSVFAYLHNETINIHSHLWGAALFAYFLVTFDETYLKQYPGATWADSLVFMVFLSSAIFCMSASAFYHTSTCHSERVASRCHALDYSGIVVLTVGSFYPALYYGFFCSAQLQFLYIGLITSLGLGAAYIVLNPEYSKPTHRGARTGVFIALGLSAVAPISHCLLTQGSHRVISELGFGWLVFSGALYIAGALLYANRIPERFSPGTFDYFFASHQIFHCCVVGAAGAHYVGVLIALNYSYSRLGRCES